MLGISLYKDKVFFLRTQKLKEELSVTNHGSRKYQNFNQLISNAVKDYQELGTWNSDIRISDIEYQKALEVFEFSNLISKKYSKEEVVLYAED